MQLPRVLVLAIVKNEISTISECVSSILSQTIPCQVLFSDNYSDDGTYEFLKEVADKNDNFHVIRPDSEISIIGHFQFLVKYTSDLYQDIPYRILIGGDDAYEERNLLEELLLQMEKMTKLKIDSVIALPSIRLVNCAKPTMSKKLSSIKFIDSKVSVTRVIGISLVPFSMGYFNLVLGMMTKDQFKYWSDTLISAHEKKDFVLNAKRNTKPEYFATLKLLFRSRINMNSSVTLLKRQHNRDSDGNRSYESKTKNFHVKSKIRNFRFVLRSQILSSTQLLSSVLKYRKDFNRWELLIAFMAGVIAPITNMRHLFWTRFFSRPDHQL